MASIEELKEERLKKLKNLKDAGMEPYPSTSGRLETLENFLKRFDKLLEADGGETILAGRIMAKRDFGNSIFIDLNDGSATAQAYLKKDNVGDESLTLFSENIDIGDFIEVKGSAFETKKGEPSLLVEEWRLLSKSLRPLPEKWHGLQNSEERFRRRYLDLLLNPDLRELFKKKSKFWEETRNFMKKEGFLEVETPTLEITTGGAEAQPFKTYHEDFDLDVYLRISVGELWQKRLMAAGFEKTYEVGRVYRNEGTSSEHTQEFTNMEYYWAYADYKDGMELSKKLYLYLAENVFGKTKFETRNHTFDLSDKWETIDYVPYIETKTGINVLDISEKDLNKKLDELNINYDGNTKERMVDSLWKELRKEISGPAFLINHPRIVSPLAKRNKENSNTVERFQIIIAGSEVGNGYSELNNPIEQRERFKKQQELLKEGDKEAMMEDDEFIEMLEHGIPPTCGFGFGERLFAFLADKSIREVQMFPLMKPRE